jgi:hypothetical protein
VQLGSFVWKSMIGLLATAAVWIASAGDEPVELRRVFAKGEKAQYEVKSSLTSEVRVRGLSTWMPEDFDLNYKFAYEVTELKSDGFCVLRYKRPTMTEIQGETFERPPITKVEKVNMDALLTVSPINDITDVKDLSKKDSDAKEKPKKPARVATWAHKAIRSQDDPLFRYIGEIYRISLFAGSLESALDFAPKLPFDEVQKGDSWKRTIGYSPQKLSGSGDKLAVQRLDYTYRYDGVVESSGKQVHRVTAETALNTDLAKFLHQSFKVTSAQTGLKEVPLSFKGSIEFDLDLKTFRTLRAVGLTEGGFRIVSTRNPSEAELEERFKTKTTMRPTGP